MRYPKEVGAVCSEKEWEVRAVKQDMKRVLVESAVGKMLDNFQTAPEREIRNLVDMGLNFAEGRFQKQFLQTAQRMLRDPKSAYYELVKRIVSRVDRERLVTFGMNVGYNGCTQGARRIRTLERERGFNIPWALNLEPGEETLREDPAFYPGLVSQGRALGIYTYLLFAPEDAALALPLMEGEKDCAFLLFLSAGQLTGPLRERLWDIKNVMVSIRWGREAIPVCRELQEAGFLTAVHFPYSKEDAEEILSDAWLEALAPARPAFAFLRAEAGCPQEVQSRVYRYVRSVRDSQRYPVALMDLKQDSLLFDRIISDDAGIAGFDKKGCLWTVEGPCPGEEGNIFRHSLEEILRAFVPDSPFVRRREEWQE